MGVHTALRRHDPGRARGTLPDLASLPTCASEEALPGLPDPTSCLLSPDLLCALAPAPRPCLHSAWLCSDPSSGPCTYPCPFLTSLRLQDSAPGPLLCEAFPGESPHSDGTLYLLVKALTPRARQPASLREDKDRSRGHPPPGAQRSPGWWRLHSAHPRGTRLGCRPHCRAPRRPRGR